MHVRVVFIYLIYIKISVIDLFKLNEMIYINTYQILISVKTEFGDFTMCASYISANSRQYENHDWEALKPFYSVI